MTVGVIGLMLSAYPPLALTPNSESCESVPSLHARAVGITVNLLSKSQFLGSGTIIARRGNSYTVVTNTHVVRDAPAPYEVRTADSRSHRATLIESVNLGNNDLVLLQFEAKKGDYSIAKYGRSTRLKKGETVYASGFPDSQTSRRRFHCRVGRVVIVLKKAIEGGYQVGYTNRLDRGMSGGPLLNQQGELVGINSLKADPLWTATEYYEDGSVPSPELQILIERSSWAISVERLPSPSSKN